ncbi:DUF5615 family PIN-like protein [Candidatus Gottesmanbacteria bacterium]|nr:DUF5615 family PIN-like protein [Candidatus Gottesmanbacteria bacterium]
MGHKWHKYKLLLDENLPPRTLFRRLNSRHTLKHIVHDFHQSGLKDPDVYTFAIKRNLLIVTFNEKDFFPLTDKSKKSGIISVSPNLSTDQIDKKLTSLLSRHIPNELYGKFHKLSHET